MRFPIINKLIKRPPIKRRCVRQAYYSACTHKLPDLAQAYNPATIQNVELRKDMFEPAFRDGVNPFSIILPPPNITGTLHLGHALTVTIQDILVKWNRMRGVETIWVPGFDHAGIATQVIVEKKLWNEKKLTRHDIGRDKFLEHVQMWKDEKQATIENQLRRLGASLDWQHAFFTMDAQQSSAVCAAFERLYDQGLIYQSDQLVNWSCQLRSTISDIEVEHLQIDGRTELNVPGYEQPIQFGVMTNVAYKLLNGIDEIVIATTRPETLLGDVAIAVHPHDERYYMMIGERVWHPIRAEPIPIIADEAVDPKFGTGAVKITPAHDHLDFAIADRHDLDLALQVIDETGRLTHQCGEFAGMRRFDARLSIVQTLHELGLHRGETAHAMSVPQCSRSKDIVELLIKPQWFINCKEMARVAVKDVREGRVRIEPKHFEKVWIHWLENIRDWCISRQLWWGHRIPLYHVHHPDGQYLGLVSAASTTAAAQKAREKFAAAFNDDDEDADAYDVDEQQMSVQQVEDVLDTWFSSALLPMSAFGWPQQSDNLLKYYPLSLMETGYDIMFFWIARMMMLGRTLTGRNPFTDILLHGIVCDAHGRKMSKSRGNVVAPEDVIGGRNVEQMESNLRAAHASGLLSDNELAKALTGQKKMFPMGIHQCGVDALRFTLCSHNIKSQFINFDVHQCRTNQFFGNKLWQATKYALKWCETLQPPDSEIRPSANDTVSDDMDAWITSRASAMLQHIDEAFNTYELHRAANALKQFLYYEFCDVYLEYTKRAFKDPQEFGAAAINHCYVLVHCLDVGLRALAPFMPYLAQHLHQYLPQRLVTAHDGYYPMPVVSHRRGELEANVDRMLMAAAGIRRLRKIFGVNAKHEPQAVITSKDPFIVRHLSTIIQLSGTASVTLNEPLDEGFVSDRLATANGEELVVHLFVPDDVRAAFEFDVERMMIKRSKLVADLKKLQNGGGDMKHVGNVDKKIEGIQEKIARLDLIVLTLQRTNETTKTPRHHHSDDDDEDRQRAPMKD